MIYRRRRARTGFPRGFYRLQGANPKSVFGFADGDFVRLRDEFGNVWRGQAELQGDATVRLRFRDSEGRIICGISDALGVILRDEHGNTWRGFID